MREIEFRGKGFYDNVECKDEDCKQWIFGSYCIGPGPTYFIQTIEDITTYKVNPETVGQYTGLKDKNGVKIFEGDIFTVNGKYPKIIKYLEDCACFGFANTAALEQEEYMDIWQQADKAWWNRVKEKIEVIGNIHDNPELLEAKE